jgi:hypothetical protein
MRAYYGDVGLMRRLLSVPGRSTKWDEKAGSVAADLATGPAAGRTGPVS